MAKAAWPIVCTSKEEGGLGVLNLQTHNEALILKHLHKFFNKSDLPWVELIWDKYYRNGRLPNINTPRGSFWWRDALKLLDKYNGLASVIISSGQTCLLWDDLWNGQVRKMLFPELHSFARNKSLSLSQAHNSNSLLEFFNLPLSVEAHLQFQELQLELSTLRLNYLNDKVDLHLGISHFLLFQSL